MENRIYKFRAWDIRKNEWIYYTLIDAESGRLKEYGLWIEKRCEFTGLHDRNGVEIYEGDIVRAGGSLWIIEFIQCFCAFRLRFAKSNYVGHCELTEGIDIEVIGNIYQHPELLKGK